MRKILSIVIILGLLAAGGTAIGQRKKPSSAIFKIKYDGECVVFIVHAYGTQHDQFQLSIEGIYLPTRKSSKFGGSKRFRLPKGMTKDGIKGEICSNIPHHRDRNNVRINAVIYKNGKIVDRVCGYSGRGANTSWGCR